MRNNQMEPAFDIREIMKEPLKQDISTEENRTYRQDKAAEVKGIPPRIAEGTFLLLGYGESYLTEIIKGPDVVRRMMVAMYGDDESTWTPEDKDYWASQVYDEDNWAHDIDYGPTLFKADVGETDHIELIRIEPQSPTPSDAKAGRYSINETFGNFFILRNEDSFIMAMSPRRDHAQTILDALNRNKELEEALKEIANHKFVNYGAARGRIYDGQYGIGVVDGHRACAVIARKALKI
jgi:hypothetical protein